MLHDVIVVGAGPYGLSAAAHLKWSGLNVRVQGEAMEFWAKKMPAGMFLRSPRVASNISDPEHVFTLDGYESLAGLPPAAPVPLDVFVDYGRWFSKHLADDLDCRLVKRLEQTGNDFEATLSDGEVVRSRRVVVAAGIGGFQRKPAVYEHLGAEHISHCYEGLDLRRFADKKVAVIGAGNALESGMGRPVWWDRSPPGIAGRPRGCTAWARSRLSRSANGRRHQRLVATPNLVARFPLAIRDKIRTRAVRPAGSRWLPNPEGESLHLLFRGCCGVFGR